MKSLKVLRQPCIKYNNLFIKYFHPKMLHSYLNAIHCMETKIIANSLKATGVCVDELFDEFEARRPERDSFCVESSAKSFSEDFDLPQWNLMRSYVQLV